MMDLTKREQFAMVTMHGLLSNDDAYMQGELVKEAVEFADALIAELDGTPKSDCTSSWYDE